MCGPGQVRDQDGNTAMDLIPGKACSVYDFADIVQAVDEVGSEATGSDDMERLQTPAETKGVDMLDGWGGGSLEEGEEAGVGRGEAGFSEQGGSVWSASLGESRQTQHSHSSAYFSAFLTSAYSLKTAQAESAEVYAIRNILRVVQERVEAWHATAEKEMEMAAPVLCWNGCGHRTRFEEMTTHVRDSCSHKPTVCGACSEVHPAHHMHVHLTQECCKRLIACPNTKVGCRCMVQAHYMDTHINLRCAYRLAYCRLRCGKQFPVISRDDHEKNHCKKRDIECPQCHDPFPSESMPHHIHHECPCRQVRCKVGCLEWINIQDIERHEKFECVQPCRWQCGEIIGPLQRRVHHELTQCLNRAVDCRNACGITGLTARNEADHIYNYCANATTECPHHCGQSGIRRRDLHLHLDPWHGTCPARGVRCPSNLVGWRIRYNNCDEGIVIKYRREESLEATDWDDGPCALVLPDSSDRTWSADGVDLISVKFADRHEWIPYWSSDIVPLRRVVKSVRGENASDGDFPCGWIPYSEVNEHLCTVCPYRVVLMGAANPKTQLTYSITATDELDGDGAEGSQAEGSLTSVESFHGTDSLMSSLNAFDGQAARAKSSVQMAQSRHEINEFLVATPANVTCDYCSLEMPPDNLEWHVKYDCTHVLTRCKFGCGAKIIRRQVAYHMAHDCPKRNVHCPRCDMEMWADEVEQHLEKSCPCRGAECPNECEAEGLTAGTLEAHMRDNCPNRLHHCDCGMTFQFHELSDHLITQCTAKPGLCPQGCGLIITRDKLDDHMEFSCPNKHVFQNKLVPCPLNCGQRLKRLDVMEHVSYYCIMRLTECPYRCGNTFRKEKLGDHMMICPNRPLHCERGMPTCQFKLHQWFWQAEGEEDEEDSIMTEPDMFSQNDHYHDDQSPQRSPHGKRTAKSAVSFALTKDQGRVIPQSNFASVALMAKKNKAILLQEDDGDLGSVDSATLSLARSSSSVSCSDGRLAMKEALRLQTCPKHGRSLLMYAVRYNELSLAKYIVDKTKGEDLDLQDHFGDTAMTLACRLQNAAFVELLIHFGADVNMETSGGKTPLIEATKVNNRQIVELLITAGAVVKFKTSKHAKSACDWAKIMKNEDLFIYLDLGSVVQTQMEKVLRAISSGNDQYVIDVVKDGEFFSPTNSTRFQEAMERYVELSRESRVIVDDYSTQLKELQDDAAAKEVVYLAAKEEEVAAEGEYQRHMAASNSIRVNIGARFEKYDKRIASIRVFDIEEIIGNRNPALSTRIAILAYALLFGVLDMAHVDSYLLDMAGIKSWWPTVMSSLLQLGETMKRLQTFSWISLQSPHLAALGAKVRSLTGEFHMAVEDEKRARLQQQQNSKQVLCTTKSAPSTMNPPPAPPPVEEIPAEEWDSDDENAGDGEWVKGKWVPTTKLRSRWWDRDGAVTAASSVAACSPVAGFKKKRNNVVNMAEKLRELEQEQLQAEVSAVSGAAEELTSPAGGPSSSPVDGGDTASVDPSTHETKALGGGADSTSLVLVDCMSVLMDAVTAMVNDLEAVRANQSTLRAAKFAYDDKKSISDGAKSRFDQVSSRAKMIEAEMNKEVKKLLLYRRRIQENKERLRVTRLMNQVSPCGHTIISWAAATGSYEVMDHLLSRGGTTGYPEDLVHMSASVIQCTYRLFLYHSSYAKRKKIQKQREAAEAVSRGDLVSREGDRRQSVMDAVPIVSAAAAMNMEEAAEGSTRAAHGVEEMFSLKAKRETLFNRINRRRRSMRFPVPEALYNGHAHIVSRINERKLLHFNFIGSWLFPSPPPPRPRVHRRLELQGPKYSFLEIAQAAREEFAAGMLMDGGWVRRLSPEDPFSEMLVEMTALWTHLCEKIANKVDERRRVRILVEDSRRQKIHKKEMDMAIRTADFKKCLAMAVEDKCSIDFETEDGLTALIVAAEENIGGLHHHYIINDDFQPVLAVCYLLDRPEHAPGVNEETKFGNTALLHACALGREHVVEALLNRHADLHRRNKFGQSAIHVAALNGSTNCIRLLMDRGADATLEDGQGRTPYALALEKGFTDVLSIIGQITGGFLGAVAVNRGALEDMVNCPMGCGKFMIRYDVDEHLPHCVLRTVPCPLGCDDPHIIAREVDHHVRVDCPHRPMECSKCHQTYRTCDDQKHQNKLCPHRPLLCNLGCNSWVPAFELVQHQKSCLYKIMECPEQCGMSYPIVKRLEHTRHHCINRRVVCPLKCAALVVFHTLPHHLKDICPRRPMTCQWCKDSSVEYRHWAKHEATCSSRLVACTKHCGAMVQEKVMEAHLQEECSHRFVACPLKCGYKVRVVDMQTHLDRECDNRVVDCTLGCTSVVSGVAEVTTRLLAKQLPMHLKADCVERMIHCGACGLPMKAKDVPSHMRNACEMRIVNCRLGGCAKRLPYKDRDKHETFECKYRLALCPMGCGLRLVSYKMLRHQESSCDMRRVQCPLCAVELRQKILSSHMTNDCSKKVINYGGDKTKVIKPAGAKKRDPGRTKASVPDRSASPSRLAEARVDMEGSEGASRDTSSRTTLPPI